MTPYDTERLFDMLNFISYKNSEASDETNMLLNELLKVVVELKNEVQALKGKKDEDKEQ